MPHFTQFHISKPPKDSAEALSQWELENVLVTSYSTSGSAGEAEPEQPGFMAKDPGAEPVGLLLPAVQAAREAASGDHDKWIDLLSVNPVHRPDDNDHGEKIDVLSFIPPTVEVGLLLPAVQAAREAARSADEKPTEEVAFYYNKIAFNEDGSGTDIPDTFVFKPTDQAHVSALDALMVINHLNASRNAESESAWDDTEIVHAIEDSQKGDLNGDGEVTFDDFLILS